MSSFVRTLLLSLVVAEVLCLVSLQFGERLARRSARLQALGERAYERRLRALRTVWPLTRLPAAIRDRNLAAGAAILTPLILLKSAAVVPLGLIALPWLPFAALLVPGIAVVHARGAPGDVHSWTLHVARLQVTSHVAAAAVGFAATVHGPLAGRSLGQLLSVHAGPIGGALGLSLLVGIAAGWREARGVVLQGYLGLPTVSG